MNVGGAVQRACCQASPGVEARRDVSFLPGLRRAVTLGSRSAGRQASHDTPEGRMADLQAFDLDGQVAVVTGGNGGIGRAIALGLAGAGAKVAIWGRNGEKNAAALAALRAVGP